MVRALVFADGVRWHIADPTPVHEVSWPPVVAGGYTDLGAALAEVAGVLHVPPMDTRAFPPVAGGDLRRPSHRRLRGRAGPADGRAVGPARRPARDRHRADADLEVLSAFIGDPSIPPFSARDPEQLAYLVRFVSTAASQLASSPAGMAEDRSFPTPPDVPQPADGGLLVW